MSESGAGWDWGARRGEARRGEERGLIGLGWVGLGGGGAPDNRISGCVGTASLAGASAHVRVSCLPGMDGPDCFSAGGGGVQVGGNDSSHGGRTVRRALKNARSLISDLFARERFSGR